MTVHQVITGALNNGENSFSIGCVDGVNFTACAVGTDIAILAPNFDRVQIIPGNETDDGDVASSIAAVYNNKVRIFEPTYCSGVHDIVPYQWNEAHHIISEKPVSTVQWVLEGLRLLLMCDSELILYQHQLLSTAVKESGSSVTFSINEEKPSSGWDILWRTSLAFENKYVKFSPDGTLFATCGENDNLVKIWYQQDEAFTGGNNAKFHFTYLQHPAPVIGFEWRRTSRYMPRKCVQNAIITWCQDNTSRIWKQTPKNDTQLEALIEAVDFVSKTTEKTQKTRKSFKIKKARRKLVSKISQLLQKDISRSGTTSQSSSLTRSATFADFIVPAATTDSLHFCLVATIDAANDCFLVPSLKTKANVPCQPFVIHWLNNKELMFALGAEKILTDTVLHDPFDSTIRTPKTKSTSSNLLSEENIPELSEDNLVNGVVNSSKTPNDERLPSVPLSTSNTLPEMTLKDILDAKLEGLLKEWNKCVDVVFSVYPVDGSLLTWTIEWLDDTWRQPTINFASRFPNAFPITDATSLNLNLYTFNPYNPIYAEVAQRHSPEPLDSDTIEHVMNKHVDDIPKNTIHLLTSHVNGSLNLWDLTTEEGCAFTHILNIVHKSRMCGHRFHISKVVAHPVLPLLLTASHSSRKEHRTHESELILWKVSPVSPLCKSGGVRELSRLTSMFPLAFDCLSWVPAILPSSTLGTVCNSPSSCFIASNSGRLCVYQAVVDARGLLAELYSSKSAPERSIHSSTSSLADDSAAAADEPAKLSDTFNVVSTQSTAKPGCVLFLEYVEDSSHTAAEMLMLHVFNEELAINNTDPNLDHPEQQNSLVIDRSKSSTFSDNYFIVMVVRMEKEDRIRMWSLNVSAQAPVPIKNYVDDGEVKTDTTNSDNFYPTATVTPPSAAKLAISSKMIYDEVIDLPSGVRVMSCVVAAGHLPSASLYPACRAPYLLTVSCSDDHVRFIRCCSKMMSDGTTGYEWNFWRMVSGDIRSDLELDGEIYAISCAHSGRFAAAYRSCDSHILKDRLSLTEDLRVAVFECESSGGVEWLQEDSFDLEKYVIQTAGTKNLMASFDRTDDDYDATDPSITLTERIRRFVRLDWVSAEDGSHILTVGIGHTIYLFAQVSRDIAQQNIVMMKENEPHLRSRLRKASSLVSTIHCTNKFVRWMCIRALELQSADGLPPLPTAMSWVRDGMLIIGLHSEMRIYNQWNPKGKINGYTIKKNLPKSQNESDESSTPPTQKPSLNISRSHSVLEQLHKRTKHDAGSGNKMMKEIMNKVFSTIQVNESNHLSQTQKDEVLLHAISDEGLFEACRLANPMLPQYHPKQLMEMLNSGKTKRVKAILLYMIRILKQRTGGTNALQRAASLRRMASMDATSMMENAEGQLQVQKSIQIGEDENMEYEELGSIPPLPLFALFEADEVVSGEEKAANINDTQKAYDSLFTENNDEDDLDEMLNDDAASRRSRSRRFSITSMDQSSLGKPEVSFTARHCRILTEMLTHVHLPGLSSVDQMHLLSIADTLSHFSSTGIDRLVQANVSFQATHPSSETTGVNFGSAATGIESVDDCGLRFLMAMKQHEYLLKCLPLKQRQSMRTKGLSTAHIIWAFHSDTEAELYNILQPKDKVTWEELRSFGIAWWLKNTNTLRNCVEQMAKAAFQQRGDPMDACLYYLALRKKNVLTHLFKNNSKQQMAEFFKEDFTEEKWQKAALKNAFVLMSKQRFADAAGFFLLGGSLKDALQTILRRLNDLQLAMVILRIYETDPENQSNLMCELLCNEVLGIDPAEARNISLESPTTGGFASPPGMRMNQDPFQRSMAYWMIKNYSKSASTLLDEANKDSFSVHGGFMGYSLSDIFNLYWFLRKHPLVTRQRLTDAGIQVGTTEKFLQLAKELESRVTPSERRLFFRTASVHMASGCPLLALDVLLRLPKQLGSFLPDGGDLAGALNETAGNSPQEAAPGQSVNDFDWSAPSQVKQDELKLDWGSDEEEDVDSGPVDVETNNVAETVEPAPEPEPEVTNHTVEQNKVIDYISQHLKFVASLRVFMEELSTLASGYEVDGGQLRFELFRWLEKECVVLRDICDYQMDLSFNPLDSGDITEIEEITELKNITLSDLSNEQPDNYEKSARYRRAWLSAHQKLIRTFTSYCALHSGTNYRLTSVLMELLLLLLELQQDKNIWCQNGDKTRPFPLLVGSLSSCRMFLSSPLHYIENQTNDILLTVAELHEPLAFGLALPKAYELYNLCQGLSSCLYQSLTDIDNFYVLENVDGVVNRRYNSMSYEDLQVVSQPCRWPGVQSFILLLECEKDEDVPNLQLLLAECFIAVTMSLFCYSFSLFDSRWLFRLMAHEINAKSFGIMFGGAGEQKLRPTRPPPPNPSANQGDAIRAKLHARVFGSSHSLDTRRRENLNPDGSSSCWVPPKKHIFQFYAEKVELPEDAAEYDYDSEDVASTESIDDDELSQEEESRMHDNPESYAWHLLRLVITVQQLHRSKQFLQILGIDLKDIPSTSPKIDKVLKLLEKWIGQLIEKLDSYPGGCPDNFLPNPFIEPDTISSQNTPLLRKYRSLIEKGNTPFEYEAAGVLPVRRLWSYLVRQEHLSAHFIRYIYEKQGAKEMIKESNVSGSATSSSTASTPLIKIMHREQEAILAFACSNVKPSWIAVSNGREIQEMSLEALYEEQKTLADSKTSYMNNRVALDIALERTARDTFRDNDDYQVLLDGKVKNNVSFLRKRPVSGVRRLEPHPSLPYYVSGASDGSIHLWEWGLEQPLFTARAAGQYAKVTKLSFSLNGNKFAAVDGDGLLCMWQATQSMTVRKPYFNQKCHTKAAADVKFLGQTSSLLVTVGHSSGDANVTLWDTLMPSTKATVHSFIGHPDGAMCVGYLPSSQTIVSGGRHGEVCFWDIRQRQLRNSLKIFDSAAIVKALSIDSNGDYLVLGSSDGDIKIFNNDPNPVLLSHYPAEHAARGGFTLRQVGIQGVQQLFLDPGMHLLSCGADCSLKFRPLTSVVQTYG
uniref:RAVE complex protein Rav1 C-terminal domain-containing protein n=1 Tax=Panagrolaimus sp. JU765 TaxID=591449 RepID=A0AC34PUG3_9BILA